MGASSVENLQSMAAPTWVSFCLQGRDFATEDLFIGDARTQDSPGQDAELYSRHGEPTTVLGSTCGGCPMPTLLKKGGNLRRFLKLLPNAG